MIASRTYLDYNASAPLRDEARDAMVAALGYCGNPSSVHAEGRKARSVVETAREQVAALVGAKPAEVVFTSGATEANATVFAAGWHMAALAPIEHVSVLAPAQANARRIVELAVRRDGKADLDDLAAQLREREEEGTVIVALQSANNETGVLQPVTACAELARSGGAHMHCDAVQSVGRVATDFATSGIDTLSLSSHKIGGPKGVGALVVRDGVTLAPLLVGGGQERRRRAGTENVAAIAGFGAAAEAALRDLAGINRIARLRDGLEQAVREITPDVLVVGGDSQRIANTSCVAVSGQAAETLLIKFDLAGVALSSGSACSSGKVAHSHVLAAMGLPHDVAASAIRISLGYATTQADCDAFVAAWKTIVAARGHGRQQKMTTTAAGAGGPLHTLSGVH